MRPPLDDACVCPRCLAAVAFGTAHDALAHLCYWDSVLSSGAIAQATNEGYTPSAAAAVDAIHHQVRALVQMVLVSFC